MTAIAQRNSSGRRSFTTDNLRAMFLEADSNENTLTDNVMSFWCHPGRTVGELTISTDLRLGFQDRPYHGRVFARWKGGLKLPFQFLFSLGLKS